MKSISRARESTIICTEVQELPYALKRTLRMQLKEFVNFIEDAQLARRPLKSEHKVPCSRFENAAQVAAA